jgi:hypothetical protein
MRIEIEAGDASNTKYTTSRLLVVRSFVGWMDGWMDADDDIFRRRMNRAAVGMQFVPKST